MTVFLLTFGIILLAMAGLAIGVLAGRGTFNASCGGDALIKLCSVCKKEDGS